MRNSCLFVSSAGLFWSSWSIPRTCGVQRRSDHSGRRTPVQWYTIEKTTSSIGMLPSSQWLFGPNSLRAIAHLVSLPFSYMYKTFCNSFSPIHKGELYICATSIFTPSLTCKFCTYEKMAKSILRPLPPTVRSNAKKYKWNQNSLTISYIVAGTKLLNSCS